MKIRRCVYRLLREPEASSVTSVMAAVSGVSKVICELRPLQKLRRKTVIFRRGAGSFDSFMHYFYNVAVNPRLLQCQYKSLLLQKYCF